MCCHAQYNNHLLRRYMVARMLCRLGLATCCRRRHTSASSPAGRRPWAHSSTRPCPSPGMYVCHIYAACCMLARVVRSRARTMVRSLLRCSALHQLDHASDNSSVRCNFLCSQTETARSHLPFGAATELASQPRTSCGSDRSS